MIDEQHFTGMRVSVEGVPPLPPDNPPRLDEIKELLITHERLGRWLPGAVNAPSNAARASRLRNPK